MDSDTTVFSPRCHKKKAIEEIETAKRMIIVVIIGFFIGYLKNAYIGFTNLILTVYKCTILKLNSVVTSTHLD